MAAPTPTERVLPGKSLTYLDWSDRLLDQVAGKSSNVTAFAGEWRPMLDAGCAGRALPLRRDGRSGAPPVVELLSTRRDQPPDPLRRQRLSAEPRRLVLAATYLALARTFGVQRMAIDVEWHGRDEALAGPQGLDRTVGWFTSVHPLCMTVPAAATSGAG